MRARNPYLIAGLACFSLVVGAVLWLRANKGARNVADPDSRMAAGQPGSGSPSAGRAAGRAGKSPGISEPKPLRGEDAMWQIPEAAAPTRKVMTEAEVLAKGRVLPDPRISGSPVAAAPSSAAPPPVAAVPAPVAPVASGTPVVSAPVVAPAVAPVPVDNRPHSIHATDWKNKANQLVSALRAGQGAEIDHALVMNFLQGKDLQGWSPDYRNWIGDELMIVLVHDLPERAFADLKTIQENPEAPAAMRDYSVQHIGDLVANGTIDQAGVDYIWQTLAQNDPATASTALVILHRLSEQKPALVPAARVAEAAQKLLASADQRSQITAKSILRK